MRLPALLLTAIAVAAGALPACEIDSAPAGLRRTPAGSGPLVRWRGGERADFFPDLPLPNDIATVSDPTSRTGRRLDVSLTGKTDLERAVRSDLASMEGWGLSAPITVSFERTGSEQAADPAIDIETTIERMTNDDHDPSNDPFYVVNLETGVPVLLDIDSGYYPLALRDTSIHGANDPKAPESNLLFETVEEGANLPPSAYQPALDRDFDGVLDHPNTWPRRRPRRGTPVPGVDDLLTWYERETDTLILRPILPLAEKTEYAVVLTDRLRARDGQAVRSPFEAIHHPAQIAGIHRLREWLRDPKLVSYYGDLAGTGLDHVAFAWTFTTEPATADMIALRDGIRGNGAFAHLAKEHPPSLAVARTSEGAVCGTRSILKLTDAGGREALRALLATVTSADATVALESALGWVDHIVFGTIRVPSLLDAGSRSRFELDFLSGRATAVRSETVQWVIAVPKAERGHQQPFPVSLWGHGQGSHALEALLFAGDFARQGIALASWNAPGHGYVPAAAGLADALGCFAPIARAVTNGRARDLDGDGQPDVDKGWSLHPMHLRDEIRQNALDGLALLRALEEAPRSIDFDGNGTPDVGGGVFFAAGRSLGAMTAQILGAIEPAIVATAPIGGGGALSDVQMRSVAANLGQALGPFVFALPASERTDSTCKPEQRSVRIEITKARRREVEIGCLEPSDLGPQMTVVVLNVRTKDLRCARTDRDGRFHIPIATSIGDKLEVQVYTAPDAVDSYGTCNARPDAPIGKGLEATAPGEGLGLRRQSPALRRYRDLAQAALDPADPIVFAPLHALRHSDPRGLLNVGTIGDAFVPIAASITFGRAAGAVPFLPPSAVRRLPAYADYATPSEIHERLGRRTPMQLLVDSGVVEGVARLGRTTAGPACRPNRQTTPACGASAPPVDPFDCTTALFDPDWPSEGRLPFDAPHADVPLRLGRTANVRVTDETSLAAAWAPRLRGVPFGPDDASWSASERVLAVLNHHVSAAGSHGWEVADACHAWAAATYGNALIARFFVSRGRDPYYLSHPKTHGCLVDATCDFFQ